MLTFINQWQVIYEEHRAIQIPSAVAHAASQMRVAGGKKAVAKQSTSHSDNTETQAAVQSASVAVSEASSIKIEQVTNFALSSLVKKLSMDKTSF